MIKNTFLLFLLLFGLSGCSLTNNNQTKQQPFQQGINERNQQLLALNDWKMTGKIAFINKKQRQSASILWQQSQQGKAEQLNLSTLLGINVLQLERKQQQFTLEVDGESYQTENLDLLIYQLTGLNLPTRAMQFWLKGLAYLPSDEIQYDEINQLPKQLSSHYNGQQWHIRYQNYQVIEQVQLAKQLSITQGDLRIKISIHAWQL